jgi:hypothetical protein
MTTNLDNLAELRRRANAGESVTKAEYAELVVAPTIATITQEFVAACAEYGIPCDGKLEMMDGVRTTSMDGLMRAYEKQVGVDSWDIDWAESCAVLKKFVSETDAYYYARCGDDFQIWEAVALAKAEGKTLVITDNMS